MIGTVLGIVVALWGFWWFWSAIAGLLHKSQWAELGRAHGEQFGYPLQEVGGKLQRSWLLQPDKRIWLNAYLAGAHIGAMQRSA